ncbi:MAG: aspartate-semialdehyde dehydrogenase [Acidobacteria bacterium]|nr:aspartate-semialdehyde dehydrogenase [Acidobacteriota bacterium]
MADKLPVGILGATGMVGQRFVERLADHPWFEPAWLASSGRSAGRTYGEACRWRLPSPLPDRVRHLPLRAAGEETDVPLLFSALPGDVAGPLEERYARAGHAVCSNASAHRMDEDVPLVIPEVNADHTALVGEQRRVRGWGGFLAAHANCVTAGLVLALKPLRDAFGLCRVNVVTFQAVSGAGYPGVASWDILGNVIPWIAGEEEKVEGEPLKLLGTLEGGRVRPSPAVVSAQCNRVPVRDGHCACVSVELGRRVSLPDVTAALEGFRPPEAVAALPGTPSRPVVVHRDEDRPQPVLDRDALDGMAVHVGRVRPCALLHWKFFLVSHNTQRGAAGGAVHLAELLSAQGWLGAWAPGPGGEP